MQNFKKLHSSEIHGQYNSIFLCWHHLKKVIASPYKQLLRHYLHVIEYRTRDGFFKSFPESVPIREFKINKNAFKHLNTAHQELGTLKIIKGRHGLTLYGRSDDYPKQMSEWLTCGGYTKINRDELKELLEELSDNELRVYFTLKKIFEYHGSPSLGVETWPKVLRESHLNISQPTLKKALVSLEQKGRLAVAEPIFSLSRKNNRFIFVLKTAQENFAESKEFCPSIQKISSENAQNPENFAHFKEDFSKKGIKLNQGEVNNSKNQKNEEVSDFNFFGLDKIARPLTSSTVKQLIVGEGLDCSVIQESVLRFARYYFAFPEQFENPVGFLVHHLKTTKTMYLEPEWFLERHYHRDRPAKEDRELTTEAMSGLLSEILGKLRGKEYAHLC